MNWNPLRKLPVIRHGLESSNETLEKLVAEFDSADNVTKSLYQAAKKLLDHILCTGKFEKKLIDDLSNSNVFANDDFMRSVVEDCHSFVYATNTTGDEYVITLQKTLIEPLKQLKQAFAELRAAIRLHDSIQLDVIKFQRKVASYSEKEKTGATLVKLQETKQALAASQREFARRTQLLINDLTKFLAGSLEMMRPLLEGFIAAEVTWVRACKAQIAQISELKNQGDRPKALEDSFRALNSLTICSDSK